MALSRVEIGSLEHLVPIVLAVVFFLFLLKYVRNNSNTNQKRIGFVIALFIALFLVVFHLEKAIFGMYSIQEDLPLYLCSLMALLIPFYSYYRHFWMFEILVFWIIVGTLQGVVTPDIAFGYPSFDYFRYWIVHLGLLLIIFYDIFVFKLKPNWCSVFKSFLAFQLYVVTIFCINLVLDANYGYLNAKPESASVIDLLGDWPYYVFKADVILLLAFVILYGIFKISDIKLFRK